MIEFLYFIIAIGIVFFIPGDILVSRLKLHLFQRMTLSAVIGMVLFGLQGFFFGFIGYRQLSYLYIVLCALYWFWGKKDQIQALRHFHHKRYAIDYLLVMLIAVGSLVQLLTVWFIGVSTNQGLVFCCFWPDAFYHLALTNQLIQFMPAYEPGMSGVVVHNYHYLANLINAELIRLFGFPLISLQYRYMGILISLLLGCSAAVFGQLSGVGKSFTRWLVFFLYFSGDIIFILLFFYGTWDKF